MNLTLQPTPQPASESHVGGQEAFRDYHGTRSWKFWKFGLEVGDASKLYEQYYKLPFYCADRTVFDGDLMDISEKASSLKEFEALLLEQSASRRHDADATLNDLLDKAVLAAIPKKRWALLVLFLRTRSADRLIAVVDEDIESYKDAKPKNVHAAESLHEIGPPLRHRRTSRPKTSLKRLQSNPTSRCVDQSQSRNNQQYRHHRRTQYIKKEQIQPQRRSQRIAARTSHNTTKSSEM